MRYVSSMSYYVWSTWIKIARSSKSIAETLKVDFTARVTTTTRIVKSNVKFDENLFLGDLIERLYHLR